MWKSALSLCLLFLCINSAFSQFIGVVDGYDVPSRFQNSLSFHPNIVTGEKWKIRYLSGRHMRLLTRSSADFSQVIPYMLAQAGQVATFVDIMGIAGAEPWVISFDGEVGKAILRRRNYTARADDLPVINSRYFDAISNNSSHAKNLEWTAAFFLPDRQKCTIVHYRHDGSFWQPDTIDSVDRIRGQALRYTQHSSGTKTIATVSDSLFRVRMQTSGAWNIVETSLHEKYSNILRSASTRNGSPIWIYGRKVVALSQGVLSVQSVVLDTATRVTNQGAFVDNYDNLHLLYHMLTLDRVWSLRYIRLGANGDIHNEIIAEPAPNNISGDITVRNDSVIVALADLHQQTIQLYENTNGEWQHTILDKPGDLGIELGVAHSQERHATAVAYYDATNGGLKLADVIGSYQFETSPKVQLVAAGKGVGRYPNAVFSEDTIHVVYVDAGYQTINHAFQINHSPYSVEYAPWEKTTIDSIGPATLPFALTNEKGPVEIAYQNSLTRSIDHARFSGTDWHVEHVTDADLQAPGEISLIRTSDSLFVGYVEAGTLRLAARDSAGPWHVEQLPSTGLPTYAAWVSDVDDNVNVVYRTQVGFGDEMRHARRLGGVWDDASILTTFNTGTYLRLRRVRNFNNALILAFADDSRAQTYCYGGHNWFKIMEGSRFMSDTSIDFTLTDFFTLTLFYRALGEIPVSYDPEPFPEVVADVVTSIVDNVEQALADKTSENSFSQYPNPFNEETTIEYVVPEAGTVRISIYNMAGQRVRELVNEAQPRGTYRVALSAADLSSGVYFCHYSISGSDGTVKMALVK